MTRRALSFAAIALALLTAGCTGEELGDPSAAPTPSTPQRPASSGTPGNGGVPTVANPLDVSHFRQEPCDAISVAKITEYFGPGLKGEPDLNAAAAACIWNKSASHAAISVGFIDPRENALGDIYAQRDEYALFEELEPIDGYPVVALGSTDDRDKGQCRVVAGVNDRDTFDVIISLSEERVGEVDPCEAAHEAAGVVLENVQERN